MKITSDIQMDNVGGLTILANGGTQSILEASGVTIRRTRFGGEISSPIAVMDIPNSDAFIVNMQLVDSDQRHWRGDLALDAGIRYLRGDLSISNLQQGLRIEVESSCDFISFEVTFSRLRQLAAKIWRPNLRDFRSVDRKEDGVVLGVVLGLLPSLDSKLIDLQFMERLVDALLIHLAQHYGGVYFPADQVGTLARWQEEKAIEYLMMHLNGIASLAEVATECDLSRSYFVKAFKKSFGQTPHQWLNDYRIAKARDLLQTDTPIAEIASECGFFDQSHLSRAFSAANGTSPGTWRKMQRD